MFRCAKFPGGIGTFRLIGVTPLAWTWSIKGFWWLIWWGKLGGGLDTDEKLSVLLTAFSQFWWCWLTDDGGRGGRLVSGSDLKIQTVLTSAKVYIWVTKLTELSIVEVVLVRRLLSLESEFIVSLCWRYRCWRTAMRSSVAAVDVCIFSIATDGGFLMESKIFAFGRSRLLLAVPGTEMIRKKNNVKFLLF